MICVYLTESIFQNYSVCCHLNGSQVVSSLDSLQRDKNKLHECICRGSMNW